MIIFALCALVMGMTASAYAGAYTRTLTVGSTSGSLNSTVTLPITLGGDTQGSVGGVSFTLTYDPTKLQFVAFSQATPTFLDPTSFSDGLGGYSNPYASPNSKPQSSIFYQVNSNDAATGTVRIAAASAQAITNAALFNVQFKIIAAFTGTQTVTITQTSLAQNTTAGYTEASNPIPVVAGMPSMTADNNGKYPTMDTFTTTPTNGNVSINAVTHPDINGDSTIDGRDALKIVRCLMGLDSGCNLGNGDVNGDSTVDGRDALKIVRCLMGLDTTGCVFLQ